jgi:hypothetical protein
MVLPRTQQRKLPRGAVRVGYAEKTREGTRKMAADTPARVAKYLLDAPLGITAPGWAGMGVCIYLATRSLWFLFGVAFFAALGACQRRIERRIKERKARRPGSEPPNAFE